MSALQALIVILGDWLQFVVYRPSRQKYHYI